MSRLELANNKQTGLLNTAKNTLEGKQFFKSEAGVIFFAERAAFRTFSPPYRFVLIFDLDDTCFPVTEAATQILDDHVAITITEGDLAAFNNCVTFIGEYGI